LLDLVAKHGKLIERDRKEKDTFSQPPTSKLKSSFPWLHMLAFKVYFEIGKNAL
jgi:hypothetical protein